MHMAKYPWSIVVAFDRNPSIYPDGNIVEWLSTGAHADQDGFEIKWHGDVSVPAHVIFHLRRTPEQYKLAEPLAAILNTKKTWLGGHHEWAVRLLKAPAR